MILVTDYFFFIFQNTAERPPGPMALYDSIQNQLGQYVRREISWLLLGWFKISGEVGATSHIPHLAQVWPRGPLNTIKLTATAGADAPTMTARGIRQLGAPSRVLPRLVASTPPLPNLMNLNEEEEEEEPIGPTDDRDSDSRERSPIRSAQE